MKEEEKLINALIADIQYNNVDLDNSQKESIKQLFRITIRTYADSQYKRGIQKGIKICDKEIEALNELSYSDITFHAGESIKNNRRNAIKRIKSELKDYEETNNAEK